MYSLQENSTHYAFFDIEINGKDAGRVNFELFGDKAPKTVNNFLAFCTGEYHQLMRYKGTRFHQIVPGKFIKGGDFVKRDGTGSKTVYGKDTIPCEKNNLKFKEPFLLAASANDQGEVGSQFFITLDAMPALNKSDHTIFGRLISGVETIKMIQEIEDLNKLKQIMAQRNPDDVPPPESMVYIKNSGVYKFEAKDNMLRKQSAVGSYDFVPQDFYDRRKNK